MNAYPLRNIPDELWHRVKVRATTEDVSMRDVILAGLERYAAGKLEVQATLPLPRERKKKTK